MASLTGNPQIVDLDNRDWHKQTIRYCTDFKAALEPDRPSGNSGAKPVWNTFCGRGEIGIRSGLKIRRSSKTLPVQVRPPAPFHFLSDPVYRGRLTALPGVGACSVRRHQITQIGMYSFATNAT